MEPHVLRRLAALLLLAAALPLRAAGFWDSPSPGSASRAGPDEAVEVEAILAGLSDEDRLAQLLMLGYIGTAPSPEILRWVGERHIGGVKIFTRNVGDLPDLARDVARMQRLSQKAGERIPLFIATDQEGGWVRHIKKETSVSPGNLAIGAARLPRDAYLTGLYIGEELAALGINMNFAPTADVYANPEASVIGPRSFGSDPQETGLLSAAYARGMQEAGILCTAKHFPGHGSADQDSHGHLPVISADLDTLRARDLVPYRILTRQGIPAIMSAHLAFPAILGDRTPASLSPFFMKTLLRDEIGFQGIVITDDMEMEGVLNSGIDTPTACRRAIEAGNDMVLISHSPPVQERTWEELRQALRTSASFRRAVTDSARRIITAKVRFFRAGGARSLPPSALPDGTAAARSIPAPGAAEFFFESSCRSVSLLAGARVPFRPAKGDRVLLCGQFPEFIAEGTLRLPAAQPLLFPFMPFYGSRAEDRARVLAAAAASDTVIFCLSNFNSLEVLKGLKGMAHRLIVISALSPVYLSEVPWVETSIAVYGSGTDSFRAGFAALMGDYTPTATLPVRFGPAAGGRAALDAAEGSLAAAPQSGRTLRAAP
jgi:beta-N-acetylhexosaminidase